MKLLYEISSVRQVPGEERRRWFASTHMDLFVWCGEQGALTGFQLAYDKETKERALTWKVRTGFVHDLVDDGELRSGSRYKETPLLQNAGQPNIDRILELFDAYGTRVPIEIASFIVKKILEFPAANRPV
ncbi:MAG: hypothetical protein V4723_04190 [Pseudomonadota bacterium]